MNMANMEGCSLLLWKAVKGLRKEQGSRGLVSNNTKKTSRGLSDPEPILLELFLVCSHCKEKSVQHFILLSTHTATKKRTKHTAANVLRLMMPILQNNSTCLSTVLDISETST